MLAVSWPTYGLFFFIFFAFIPLIYLVDNTKEGKILQLTLFSFLTFFTWNILTTFWLYYATFLGMSFAIIVNSALMSCVVFICLISRKRLGNKLSVIFFISLWICFEKLHLNWDFSWPWLNLGNVFSENVRIIQWYEYTGTFGGTLWVLCSNFIGYFCLRKIQLKESCNIEMFSLSFVIFTPMVCSLLIYKNITIQESKIKTVIVQPNIDPYDEKFNRSDEQNLIYLESILSDKKNRNSVVILPETYFSDGSQINTLSYSNLILRLKQLNKIYNTEILTGIELFEIFDDSAKVQSFSNKISNNRWLDLFNGSLFVSDNIEIYKKSKLVVGIEKMPYKNILEPLLGSFLIDFGGLSYSRGNQPVRSVFNSKNDIKIAPVICYESIYGEYVSDYIKNGANLLAIITNDGWWNNTQGHRQHLSYARLRSIETRKNIIRSANTGISSVINYRGEIVKTIAYDKEGLINHNVGVNSKITFYTLYGDFIFRISLFFIIILSSFFFSKILSSKK